MELPYHAQVWLYPFPGNCRSIEVWTNAIMQTSSRPISLTMAVGSHFGQMVVFGMTRMMYGWARGIQQSSLHSAKMMPLHISATPCHSHSLPASTVTLLSAAIFGYGHKCVMQLSKWILPHPVYDSVCLTIQGTLDNSNSFQHHSDITNCRNIDLLGY